MFQSLFCWAAAAIVALSAATGGSNANGGGSTIDPLAANGGNSGAVVETTISANTEAEADAAPESGDFNHFWGEDARTTPGGWCGPSNYDFVRNKGGDVIGLVWGHHNAPEYGLVYKTGQLLHCSGDETWTVTGDGYLPGYLMANKGIAVVQFRNGEVWEEIPDYTGQTGRLCWDGHRLAVVMVGERFDGLRALIAKGNIRSVEILKAEVGSGRTNDAMKIGFKTPGFPYVSWTVEVDHSEALYDFWEVING